METSGNFNPGKGSAGDTAAKVAEAARPAVDQAASAAHQTVDNIAGAANEAVETLASKSAQLKEFQERLVNNCCSYVQQNPMTSVGIALATGFLLSRLISSR